MFLQNIADHEGIPTSPDPSFGIVAGAADSGSWWATFHLNIRGKKADNKRWKQISDF